jgi:FkbM family methyltransferase
MKAPIHGTSEATAELMSLLRPKPCPTSLIRIGGDGDGAYLVPDDLQGIEACFSPGVFNFKNFEDELSRRFEIKCHMCDFSSDVDRLASPLIAGMQTFEKKWLDLSGVADSITLEAWVDRYSPNPMDDLLLQIDIEGAEYRNLSGAAETLMRRFRVIVIEMHGLEALKSPTSAEQQVGSLLRKLDRTHVCVHAHPNNCCDHFMDSHTGMNVPSVIELTYLRRDRFPKDFQDCIEPQLPHPQDIRFNVASRPPLHLNESWLATKRRSPASFIKALEDELDFLRREIQKAKRQEPSSSIMFQAISNLFREIDPAWRPTGHRLSADTELAQGKNFSLSSGYGPFPAQGKVSSKDGFFFHTGIAPNQSITIDLGQVYELAQLTIRNRTDCCFERAASLFWTVLHEPAHKAEALLPVITPPEFCRSGSGESVTPLLRRRGRYLTIFSPADTALHFSSIEVWGCVPRPL